MMNRDKAHKRNQAFKFTNENQHYVLLLPVSKLHDQLIRVAFEYANTFLV